MIQCPSCSREILPDSRVCSYCGAPVGDDGPTVTRPRQQATAPSATPSSDSIDEARFTPGTMLTERYRIVGLLGRGGMGEVYRADDLKLRQPVALKFLPEALAKDPRRLDRFLHEVRIARQVSHPNVCRVYDIGEVDGQHFISMEYVDGEDLATMSRRLGRPSKEKALQVARQLCAGLAAAHDKGVLHRDLKPHNVMIDGRGVVRVTDFGLAGFVEDFTGHEVLAGTPAYMAPEQLAGREVSVKSDIYSLGLVVFELFTGRRAFSGATREEIERSRSEPLTSLSQWAQDVEPAVERVILRCLEKSPVARPSSALAVAAALPGGDPLAAALEAGETPAPELVAAAGDVGGLRPAVAIPCLVGVLIGLIAVAFLSDRVMLPNQAGLNQPPQALAFRASHILEKLGHASGAADTAVGFVAADDVLRYIQATDKSPDRWRKLATNRPPGMYFWYRQSPRTMIPPPSEARVTPDQPPFDVTGMVYLVLDPDGRLLEFEIVPPQRDTNADGTTAAPDWASVFAEADLDFASFRSVEPTWTPTVFCQERAAWEGPYPNLPGVTARVEAGSYGAQPTFFKLIGPWTKPTRQEKAPVGTAKNVFDYAFVSIVLLVIVGSVGFAWSNLKKRRGDRRGAFRASLVFFVLAFLAWALGSIHIPAPWEELDRYNIGASQSLYFAGVIWLLYIAFEPYVRRRWPHSLISWTRLLMGRARDPLVGRDLLAGCLFGIGVSLLWSSTGFVLQWIDGYPPLPAHSPELESSLLGTHVVLARLLEPWFCLVGLWHLFVLYALRVILRRQWAAVAAYVAIFSIIFSLGGVADYAGPSAYVIVLSEVLTMSLWVTVLLGFGLLPLVVTALFFIRLADLPITLDFSQWYAGASVMTLLMLAAVAVYGFHTALAGRPLLRDELLET